MASSPCFICDEKTGNDKVHLATGIAPHSKLGIPAKISNLIGDEFVVVVCQSDNICRRCSALINHMDKLETELVYVKKAITGYIRVKYNLPLDEDSKNNAVNGDVSPAKKQPIKKLPQSQFKSQSTPTLVASSPGVTPKPAPATTPSTSGDDGPKMKIYKCGFCSYQSKDLNSVRSHMRVHIKPKPEEMKKTPATPTPTAAATTAPVSATTPTNVIRKKLFRCQVCSASFVDRKSCLQHIKLTHSKTAASQNSNKENEQQQQQQHQQQAQQQQQEEEAMDTQPTEAEEASGQDSLNEPDHSQDEQMDTQPPPTDVTTSIQGDAAVSQQSTAAGEESIAHQEDSQSSQDTDLADAASQGEGVNDAMVTEGESGTGAGEEGEATGAGVTNPAVATTAVESSTGGGEQEEKIQSGGDMDIEAMIAALHSDGSATNSESIAMNM